MKRRDFQQLAALRLREARVLLAAQCWEGAYYLAGYAVECALKACIARKTERYDFPDKRRVNASHTHDVAILLAEAGLKPQLEQATDLKLSAAWIIVRNWKHDARYERPTQIEAEELIYAIGARGHGVMTWLRRRW